MLRWHSYDCVTTLFRRSTAEETNTVIWALKNGKAAGLNEIPPELLKSGDQCLVDALMDLLNDFWATSVVPEEWKRGEINTLQKRRSLQVR